MKKHTVFSFGLYREGLRRLRIPGIIFLVILTLEAIFIPLTHIVSMISDEGIDQGALYTVSISATRAHPLLCLSFAIMAPILTWTLFSWMNHRNSSDLYHALPYKRSTVYISLFSSLITWIAILVFLTSGVSRIMLAIFGKYFELSGCGYLQYMLGCFAASVLASGAVSIGITLTGTILNNIVVSALIIYLPRFVIQLVILAVSSRLSIIPDRYLPSILDSGTNIAASPLTLLISPSYRSGTSVFDTVSCVYTASIAILYAVLGGILFCRRQSESAEKSAPSTFLQSVYRIAVTMVICVPVCCMVFIENSSYDYDLLIYVIFYTAALITYFSYELITTKKWRNLPKTLPGLGIVVLLNVLLYASMYGLYSTQLNFTPAPEEIKSVSIMKDEYYDSPYGEQEYVSDVLHDHISELRITAPDALRAVSDALRETIEEYRNDKYPYDSSLSYRSSITVCIRSGYIDKYRTIRVTSEQLNTIQNALCHTEGYSMPKLSLPKPYGNDLITFGNAQNGFTEAEMSRFFMTMESELKGSDLDTWCNYLISQREDPNFNCVDYICYRTKSGGDLHWIRISFNPTVLPKTTQLYLDMTSPRNGDPTVDEILSDSGFYTLSLYMPPEEGKAAEFIGSNASDQALMRIAANSVTEGKADINGAFIIISREYDLSEENDDLYIYTLNKTFSLPISEAGAEALRKLITEPV